MLCPSLITEALKCEAHVIYVITVLSLKYETSGSGNECLRADHWCVH